MVTYTIKYNRASYHIAGMADRSNKGGISYAQTVCPALTRSGSRMATGQTYESLQDTLDNAEMLARVRGAKMCMRCTVAARTLIKMDA